MNFDTFINALLHTASVIGFVAVSIFVLFLCCVKGKSASHMIESAVAETEQKSKLSSIAEDDRFCIDIADESKTDKLTLGAFTHPIRSL